MRKASLIASVLMILLSIAVFIESLSFKKPDAAISVGPGFYPTLLAGMLTVFSIIIIVNTLKSKEDTKLIFLNKRVIIGIILIVGYCLIFNILGFLLSSIILFALISKVMGGNSWRVISINSVVVPVGIYFVFNNLLRVPLPWGVFENFL